MMENTWKRLDEFFTKHPKNRADVSVALSEIELASHNIGVPFSPDYSEFIMRYRGASIGIYEILGLRRAEYMSSDVETVVDLTKHFRKQQWPGVENWVVFSTDQAGNLIGLDRSGLVWLSDHDFRQIAAICRSFEEFLRTCCLSLEPEATNYYQQLPWP